jgi:23S rRNA pseudouridine1911/1915/1917 synthase
VANSNIIHAIVSEHHAGLRLDRWLATLDFIPSRSRAGELIDRGLVTLNGRALKASYKVAPGSSIQIKLPEVTDSAPLPLDAPLDVLFEDQDLIVVNKPSGLVVHPAAGHAQDTLVNILLHHTSDLSMGFNERRPGIVHRLDRDTSGVLVVAKNDETHHDLAAQFKEKTVHRIYWAVAAGEFRPPQGIVKSNLARHPSDRKRFASTKTGDGKNAVTHYRALQRVDLFTWVECRLETGRTHQIRVHLSELGHPIAGDTIYGGKFKKAAPRLLLHACELGFVHPRSRARLTFKEPWPDQALKFLSDAGFKL